MSDEILEAAERYLDRCRSGGDCRPIVSLLEEIVQPPLAVVIEDELVARGRR